jgi:CRP/FNR family transcriptional regulator, cyclic AMP receptor protein
MQSFYSEKLTHHQISTIPFFQGLNKKIIDDFIDVLKLSQYQRDDYIIREGDEAEYMYFILKGSVKIFKKNYKGGEKLICEMNEPQFFGEMALIDRGTRSSSVIASSDVAVAKLSWQVLDEQFACYNPELALSTYKKIAQALSLRLRKSNALYAHIV